MGEAFQHHRTTMNQEDIIKSKAPSGRVLAIFKDSVVYGIFLGISKVPMVLVLPILTYFLTKQDYGVLDTFIMFGSVLLSIAIVGQDNAIGRMYYDEDNPVARSMVVSTALFAVVAVSLIASVVSFIFAHEIAYKILDTNKYAAELRVVAIYIPFMTIIHIFRFVCRWTFNKKAFLVLNAAPALSLVIFTFIFVAILKKGIEGALLAQVITGAIFACVGAYICRPFLSWRINKSMLAQLLKFGLPVMTAYALSANINVVDKAMYSNIFGTETLGIYSFGARYGVLAYFATAAFASGWGPIVYASYKQKDGFATIQKTLNMVAGAFALLLFLQIATAELGMRILAPGGGYENSLKYVLPIAMSAYINGIAGITAIGVELSKKTYMYFISYAFGYLALFILPKFLIPSMGSIGIAYTVLTVFLLMFVIFTLIGHKLYPFRFGMGKPCMALSLSFGACLLFQNLSVGLVGQIFLRTTLFIGLGLIVWFSLIHIDDRKKMLGRLWRRTHES
jgi:O-antigen/teichoic acid export membrane protein